MLQQLYILLANPGPETSLSGRLLYEPATEMGDRTSKICVPWPTQPSP